MAVLLFRERNHNPDFINPFGLYFGNKAFDADFAASFT